MTEHPPIAPGDWITVTGTDCVVINVFKPASPFGVCKVVFNRAKPTTHDVDWDGTTWIFPQRPDYGGYGRDGDPYVRQLKLGRFA